MFDRTEIEQMKVGLKSVRHEIANEIVKHKLTTADLVELAPLVAEYRAFVAMMDNPSLAALLD